MPFHPTRGRCTLDWQMFKTMESGDHLLVLPPLYAQLFEATFPTIMQRSRHGFGDTQRGNNKRAFFSGLTPREVANIEAFISYYKERVLLGRNNHIRPYFKDELDFCLALDFGRRDPKSDDRTEIGQLEYDAKYHGDDEARAKLVSHLVRAVQRLPKTLFSKPRRITFVPPGPDRDHYLPQLLAEGIVSELGEGFWGCDEPLVVAELSGRKKSAKDLEVAQKIAQWDKLIRDGAIELSDDIEGDSLCIVDDLYQSGASLWSMAKCLKAAGAANVVGLACVKSLRDTGNR
jgi:predicted amidophosphoribosyltransferase